MDDMDSPNTATPAATPDADTCSQDVPIVPARVYKLPVEIFIDTGSPVNVINKDLVLKLGKYHDITRTSITLNSVTANNLSCLGEIVLPIKIGNFNIKASCVVVSNCAFPGDILMGFKCMRENRIFIRPSDLEIRIHDTTFPLTSKCNSSQGTRTCHKYHEISRSIASCFPSTVRVRDDSGCITSRPPKDNEPLLSTEPLLSDGFVMVGTTIKPHSNQRVKIQLRNTGFLNATSVPESCKHPSLLVERGVYSINSSDNSVCLCVANISDQQVSLRGKSILVQFDLLALDFFISDLPKATICALTSSPTACNRLKETILPENVHYPEAVPDLIQLLTKFKEVLPDPDAPLTKTNVMKHSIKLKPDTRPVYVHAYRLPHSRREKAEELVQEMKDKGVIRNSKSPFNAPLILVPKKNGTFRPVVDFRKLNDVTVDDRHPIPVLTDLLTEIGPGNKVFSTIDLTQGFWQVELDDTSKPYTAFSTTKGHYEFNRMPFGLKTAPITFSRIMAHVFNDLLGDTLLLYLDDMLIVSKTVEEHLTKLETVFTRLRDANLLINPEKCCFLRTHLRFLGHTVAEKGCTPNDEKTSAIAKYPRPKNAKDIRVFMGMMQFYRMYIPGFSIVAAPLTHLLKDDIVFSWNVDQETAFNTLRAALTTEPVLIHADFSQPFIVATDACKTGIGGALMQHRDGKLRPIAFFSRKCTPAEQNFSVTESEGLAVVESLLKFKDIILGYQIEVRTDHQALTSYFSKGENAQGRVGRWILKVNEFSPTIKYIPGKINVVADALSRYVGCLSVAFNESNLKDLQQLDPQYGDIIKSLKDSTPLPKVAGLPVNEFILDGDLLYRISKPKKRSTQIREYRQLVVPEAAIPNLLQWLHSSLYGAHAGPDRCIKACRKKYFFPRMASRISNFVKSCETCAQFKGSVHAPAPILTLDPPSQPFEKVALDLLDIGHSTSGNKKVLTMIDMFSRLCRLAAIPDKRPETIIRAFNKHWICELGTPKSILTDNGGEFNAEQMQRFCSDCKIQKFNITAHHPEGNGICERLNQEVLKGLRVALQRNPDAWDESLPEVQLAINSAHHSSVNESPHYIVFGQDVQLPYELHRQNPDPQYNSEDYAGMVRRRKQTVFHEVRKYLDRANRDQSNAQHKKARSKHISEGDLVMFKHRPATSELPKLAPRFEGPYRVLQVLNNKVTGMHIRASEKVKRVHLNEVKPLDQTFDPFLGVEDITD